MKEDLQIHPLSRDRADSIHVLLVEDNPGDAGLIQDMLSEAEHVHIQVECVQRLTEALTCLAKDKFDVVLLDLGLPDSSGLDTVRAIYEASPHLPCVVLTGEDNENTGLEAVRLGAQDYLVKGQVSSGHLLLRILRYAMMRQQTDEALLQSERQYRELVQNANSAIIRWKSDGTILFFNEYAQSFFAYSAEEVLGKHVSLLVPETESTGRELGILVQDIVDHPDKYINHVNENVCQDGHRVWMAWTNKPIFDKKGHVAEILAVGTDITERKHAEDMLLDIEKRLSEAQILAQLGNWIWDVKTGKVEWSEEVYRIFRLNPEEFTPQIDSILALSPWPEDHERDKELIRKAMESHEKGEYEQRFLRPDKSIGYYYSSFQGKYDDQGNLIQIIGTVQDITERKRAEESVRLAHARLQQFVDANIVGVVIANASGEIIEANDYYLNLIGFTWEEFCAGKVDWRAITPPEWLPADEKAICELRERGTCTPYEKEYLRRDGTRVSVFLADTLLPGPEEQIAAFAIDLTERKRAEENAARAGREWQRTFDATASAVWILDQNQRVVRANKTSERFFPHTCDELIGKHCWEIVHGTDTTIPECPILRARKSLQHETQELQIGMRWFEITVDPILDADGQFAGAVHIVSDISERKWAEHKIMASETRYRRLFESAKDGIIILDADTGVIVDINPFLVQMLGFDLGYLLGKKLWEIGLFKDIAASKDAFLELQAKDYIRYEDLPLETKDGQAIYVEFVSNVYLVDSIKVVQCNIRDITDRKIADEALALHTRRVQALLDLQLLSYAPETQVLDFVLDACLSMTQSAYSFIGTMDDTESVMTIHRWSSEVMAECALTTQPIEYTICAAGLWGDCVRERKPIICNAYQAPHPNKKGLPEGHVPIHRFIAVPIMDGNRIVAVAAVANKTRDYIEADNNALSTLLQKMWEILSRQRREHERIELEDQYRQAQKMEAIGQLAGGVAHDFNNILQAIVVYSSMLLDRLPQDDEQYEFAEGIAQGAERASTLTRQLLAFSRRQILEMEDLDLKEVVHGMTKMIRRLIGEDIRVETIDGLDWGLIHADQGQMEQVLLNLCINARDAMPDGGHLIIETQKIEIDKEYCDLHTWAIPGQYVLLSVTDTGCGMDAQTLTRIFEPFFTTKELGKGTGLGLATVYGIVRQHQGMVQVYSEVDKGTTFKVYLPSIERTTSNEGTKVVERARGGTETILVAEDDDTLRILVARILKEAGYTVLLAIDGNDALNVFEKYAAGIDLFLLDVIMPKMGGKAVYDLLRKQNPHLRFLFSSGYSPSTIHTNFVLKEGIDLIQKPFAPDVLLRKVRQILDQTDTGPNSDSDPAGEGNHA